MNTLASSHLDTPSSIVSSQPCHLTTRMDPKIGGVQPLVDREKELNGGSNVSSLNNTGVSLLRHNLLSEAANSFLQALWQVEAKTGQNISRDLLLQGSNPSPYNASVPNNLTNSNSDRGERATPSSYIYQREDYDEGLYVYRDALPITQQQQQQQQQQEKIKDMSDTTTGDNHQEEQQLQLMILRYNMGQVYLRCKQYNQARRWFQTAWIQAQRYHHALPSYSSSRLSLTILHNLGFAYYCLGDNETSLKCYQDALAFAKQASKEQADTYNCIAVLLFHHSSTQENETTKALELLTEAMSVYHNLCGPDSREVATCFGNLGRIHFLTSSHELALEAFHKAYGIRKNLFGNECMDTAAMLFNLGQSLHYRGALDQTLEAYQEFLRVARAYYNSDSHRDICAVQRAMAQVYRQKKELRQACIILQQAYNAGCAALGPMETEVSCILSELGSLHAEANDYPSAIDCFLRFLQTQQKVHRRDPLHNNILITKINLARVYKHSSDYLSAFRYYKEVHAMQVQLATARNGTGCSLEVASTLSSMGLMLYLLKAYKPALDCYQEALRVRLDKLGTSQHADVAETINSIGLVLFKLGFMDMAKEAFQECIHLRSKLMKHSSNEVEQVVEEEDNARTPSISSSREIAVLLFNMATACLQSGEDEQGIEWYKESLRVEREVLGRSHPDISMTLQHIARVHEDRGDFEQAVFHYREALDIARQEGGKKESVARLLKSIGNLHFMQGQAEDGMACFTEATRLLQTSTPNATMEGVSVTGANFYGFSKLHPPCAPIA